MKATPWSNPAMNLLDVAARKRPVCTDYDWSDWVPFCMLLEMKRAVRTGVFVACFFGLNLLMMTGLLAPIMLEWWERPMLLGNNFSEIMVYWQVILITFLLVLPISSFFACSRDIRTGAMEQLLATGTPSINVMVGKWGAKMMEIFLLACLLLPYAALEYFKRGTNPLYMAGAVFQLVWMSAALCSVGVAFSVVRRLVFRLFL
ncbi:MAG: hypothetical protein ACAI35_18495 [Candidatus Methylacidiphilales bacterium]